MQNGGQKVNQQSSASVPWTGRLVTVRAGHRPGACLVGVRITTKPVQNRHSGACDPPGSTFSCFVYPRRPKGKKGNAARTVLDAQEALPSLATAQNFGWIANRGKVKRMATAWGPPEALSTWLAVSLPAAGGFDKGDRMAKSLGNHP